MEMKEEVKNRLVENLRVDSNNWNKVVYAIRLHVYMYSSNFSENSRTLIGYLGEVFSV